MRVILLAVYILLAYYVVRVAFRWLLQAQPKPASGEMVLDPECKTYILKESAVTRRIGGRARHFCSKECAAAHAARD